MPPDKPGKNGDKKMLEHLISYTGDSAGSATRFDLDLFKRLNREFEADPVVPKPRAHAASYTSHIGGKRCEMLERKIGIRGLRVLELGCGDGMLSRVLARDYGCRTVGVDIQAYDDWGKPVEGELTQIVHDVTAGDNAALGRFDRVVSFAVFEHIVHPHAALQAAFDLLEPGGKAYIYANLYRGAKASHRYREVFFPWPHLLFEASVWREFYQELQGEPLQAAWVNKLTYDQYLGMANRIGFEIKEHFPSAPYFNEAFYRRFEYQLAAYPKFDLMHDFIHLVLEKPRSARAALSGRDGQGQITGNPGDAATAQLRDALAQRPLRAYDRISYAKWKTIDAAAIMAGQPFELLGFKIRLGDRHERNEGEASRSEQLFLLSWHQFEPLFVAHDETQDPAILVFLAKEAREWLGRFWNGSAFATVGPGGQASSEESFLTADTAVSNRLYRLAYLVAASAKVAAVDDETFTMLLKTLIQHNGLLVRDDVFSAQNNHGILQALAQICGTERLSGLEKDASYGHVSSDFERSFAQGNRRLLSIVKGQVAQDGVHKEHSFAYHLAITHALDWLATEGIVDDDSFSHTVRRMHEAGRWMHDPLGRIANIGDTDLEFDQLGTRENFRHQRDPAQEQTLFPEGGYWFVKTSGTHGTTYLAQSCAFHSRFHKQADSGTFIWHDRGADILIDAGRYGYAGRTEPGSPLFMDGFWYADPKRVYVESTRAHNTIEIDGRNHGRYRQPPTGGTITGAVEQDGVMASRCTVPNAGAAQHRRIVALRPGEWLAVFDTCRFGDGPHEVRQWFHLHPDWSAEEEEGRLLLTREGQRLSVLAPAAGTTLGAPVSGETHTPRNALDPGYLGWWSPQAGLFEPSPAFPVSGRGAFVTLATLFVFGDVAARGCRCVHNVTHRTIKLSWKGADTTHSLALTSQGVPSNGFGLAYTRN